MIFIERKKYEKTIESFIDSKEQILLHLFGIAGTGKTSIVRNSKVLKNHKGIFIDYTQIERLTIEAFISKMTSSFFSDKELMQFNEIVSKRINSEIYHTNYNKKHILKIKGQLEVKGDVIVGDVHNYGELDAQSKLEKKLNILTEELHKTISLQKHTFIIVVDRFEKI